MTLAPKGIHPGGFVILQSFKNENSQTNFKILERRAQRMRYLGKSRSAYNDSGSVVDHILQAPCPMGRWK